MGIKGLLKIISDNTEDCIIKRDISFYRGKIIAVDASIILYKFVIAIRNNGYDYINREGESSSHIYALFLKTLNFLKYGIKPIFVFDGQPPILKKKIIDYRKNIKNNAKLKLKLADNTNDKIKYFKKSVEIKKYHINECKELLNVLKIPYIVAPGEADAHCSLLAKKCIVWGVYTEDMDILTFGSPRIIKNLSSKNKKVIEINLYKIIEKLGITYNQFIDICILLGCDYCNTILGLEKCDILELVKKFGSLDNIISNINNGLIKYKIPYYFPYHQVQNYFKHPNVINPKNIYFKWNSSSKREIINYMCYKYNFDLYDIKNKLYNYYSFYNNI